MSSLPKETRFNINFVGLWWLWFLISGIVTLAGVVSVLTRGVNWGLDYTGGGAVTFHTAEGKSLPPMGGDERGQLNEQMQAAASEAVGSDAQVRLYADDQVGVQFRAVDEAGLTSGTQAIRDRLSTEFADTVGELRGADASKPDNYDTHFIGPKIGRELRASGLKALFVGTGFILLYLWWRFEVQFGVAAIVALLHDCFVLLGFFSIGHWEVDLAFVAVILTVLGYSVNDTVVIYDRIRENLGTRRRITDYAGLVNEALNQTLTRSINTGMTALYTLIALFLLAGPSIRTFSMGLILGITSGTYSSIFIAAQLVVLYRRWKDARTPAAVASRAARMASPSPGASPSSAIGGADDAEATGEAATVLAGEDLATKDRAQRVKRQKVATPRKSKKRY